MKKIPHTYLIILSLLSIFISAIGIYLVNMTSSFELGFPLAYM
jgi:hypothetical protein